MNARQLQTWLKKNGACVEGRRWAKGHTLEWVWKNLDSLSWMEWLLFKMLPYGDYIEVGEDAACEARRVAYLGADNAYKAYCDKARELCELVDWE